MSDFDYDAVVSRSFGASLKKLVGINKPDSYLDCTSAGKIIEEYSLFHSYGFRAGADAAITAILAGEINLEEVRKARAAYEAKD